MIDIAKIHADIEGVSEDARFLAFMTLYESEDEAASREIEHVLEWRDPILKLKLLRFLGHVPEERAARYICWLMEDENHVVIEAAERTFERNACDGKLKLLLPLLHSPHVGTQLYAIDKVGQAGLMEALDPLLKILVGCDADTPVALVLAVVTALRLMPHTKAADPLLRWMNDPRVELRFRVVMALGTIYEIGLRRLSAPLHHLLQDPEARVRQAAIWALRRRPHRHDLPRLFEMSRRDPDPQVRQEAILELGQFPTSRVIQHLLDVLEGETNRLVTLQCEAALLKMDHDDLMKGLTHIMQHKSGTARHRAMLMASEFQHGSKRFLKFLVTGMNKASTDKDRLSYIEALGILGMPEAAPALQPLLTASPIVAYVAMAAYLKVGGDDDVLIHYLEDPAGGHLLKQMILRHMVRKNVQSAIHKDRLVRSLQGFLHGDNINMRYLAAQMLIRVAGPLAREELLEVIPHEEDPASHKLLRDSLLGFFTEQPSSFSETLRKERHNDGKFKVLCDIFPDLIWSGADIIQELPQLLDPQIVNGDMAYMECCVSWVSQQVIQGRVQLDQVMRVITQSDAPGQALPRLALQLNHVKDMRLAVSPDLLAQRMAVGSDPERDAMIDLMGVARNPEAIPVLVSVICNDHMRPFHGRAVEALSQITQAEGL